jgi:hypothetical protein
MYEQEHGSSVPTQTMKALNKLVLAQGVLGLFGSKGYDLNMENLVAEWIIKLKRDTNAREKRYVYRHVCYQRLFLAVFLLFIIGLPSNKHTCADGVQTI